jgi:peptide/nickel transport system permease protein
MTSTMSAETKKQLEQSQSMTKIVFTQFLEHKLAVTGAIIISCFVLIALSAPLIAKYMNVDVNEQNVSNRYLPPFSQADAGQDVKETAIEQWINRNPESADRIQKLLIEKNIVTVGESDALFDLINKTNLDAALALSSLGIPETEELEKTFKHFGSFHLVGTDELGRDVFIRLVYGTRVSMGVGVLVAIASALFGLLIGSIAGFYGGIIDNILMRLTDSLLSLPTIPVLIVMAAIDLSKLPALKNIISSGNESVWKMVFILCLFSWMTVARLVRGSILSIREREFVLAAKTLGASDFTIIVRHMFPNVIAPMLVSITLGVGESILFEAALSFLGLGIMPPMPSWGNMLNNAQELIYQAPFLAVIPGVLILLTVVSFNYLGDGLQDAIDPKAIRR